MTMEFERQPLPLDSFPPNLQNHVKDGAPDKMKMMAAQGMVPAPPAQQLKVLYQLHFDDSVADAATDALTGMPHNVLVPAIEDESAPGVLDWVGDVHDDDQILEALVLNDNTDDATI